MNNVFAHFLQETGLYGKIEITSANIDELIDLIGGRVRISSYCTECKDMLISFSYYDYSISNSFGHNSTSDNSSDNGGSSVRNDYDNPEDLWEENQDWYEDEDEAWDEWYDG